MDYLPDALVIRGILWPILVRRENHTMHQLRIIAALLLLVLALAGITSQLAAPRLTANCAECGDGPKDKKCPDGYTCKDQKCVKK